MDKMYRRQRYIYDLTRKYYLLGRDRLIRRLDVSPGDRVLEIGCGTGRNLVYAAKRFPGVSFYGIDVSREMLASAEAAVRRAGLEAQIDVAFADAIRFDTEALWNVRDFDRVFISYTLSMIPAWQMVLRQALPLLAPGGELHIVDFGGQEDFPAWFRNGLRRWLSAFDVFPVDSLEAELNRLDFSRRMLDRPYLGYAQYAVLGR
jgi:S-adenosylmethionine-diacylgycerolhomoserine-N-methlytransferase